MIWSYLKTTNFCSCELHELCIIFILQNDILVGNLSKV